MGISRHDALYDYYFHGGITVVAERYGMIEVSNYPYLYLMGASLDGVGIQVLFCLTPCLTRIPVCY